MIGSVNTTQDFRKTLHYVARSTSEPVYANFSAGLQNDPEQMAADMAAVAQTSTRCQQPCYHISISPAPGDEISKRDWLNLAADFLAEMGLSDRQAVGWLHHDATFPDGSPRPHLHLVANRVGIAQPAVSTSWDYRKVDRVLRQLEDRYDLTPVTPANEVDVRRDPPTQVQRLEAQQTNYEDPAHPRSVPPVPSRRSQLQAEIETAVEKTGSIDGVTTWLEQQGINTRTSNRGWSFAVGGVAFAGHQLGSRYALPAVAARINTPQPQAEAEQPPILSPAERVESHEQAQRGQQLLGALQSLPATKPQFESECGTVDWEADGDRYRFQIERQDDGTQRVTGRNSAGADVFAAAIDADGSVLVEENDIPAAHSDSLLKLQQQQQRQEHEVKPPERRRSRRRTRTRRRSRSRKTPELEL